MNVLASKFRQREIEAGLARQVAKIVLELGVEAPRPSTSSLPLDAAKLRGIPCLGKWSAAGAIRGTRPGDGLD